MDLLVENKEVQKCFKCEHTLYDNLNIVYNETTSMLVLWNKFQIFVYEDRNLRSTAKVLIPEFQIHQLALSNNYIVCLDTCGNIHTTSLKFKNPTQKRFKSSFQPREHCITVYQLIQDHSLSMKYETENYFLCLHRINAEFLLEKKIMLQYESFWPLPKPVLGKCLLTYHKINEANFELVRTLFKKEPIHKDCSIVLFSVDKLSIFSCLFSSKITEDEISIIKLHTCPSEICNMEIIEDLTVLICLTTGSVLRLCLKDKTKTLKPVHLNIAIHKYCFFNNTLIYTDGISMWRSDNMFMDEITFHQFIINNVKDFIKCGQHLICTTFTNLIYNFCLDDNTMYIKSLSTSEYCAAEKLLNNSEYLCKILEEMERNNDMIKKVKEESNYITALALSNRQDIMDNIIQQNIIVYDSYDEVRKEHSDLFLTDNISKYFEEDCILLLVKLTTITFQHMFNNVLSNLLDDLSIHITLFSDLKLIKTTSIKLKESLKKINILLAVSNKNFNIFEIDAYIKIVSSIPGCHDQKQLLWTCLYRKHVSLYSEHFIKTNNISTTLCLRESKGNLDNLILKIAQNYHRTLFKFVDKTKYKEATCEWSMYLKLPTNYTELLLDNYYSRESFNSNKASFLLQQYTSKEFLESNNELFFEVGDEKVKLQITNDFTTPILKVTSENICLAYHIRNFFSKLVYNDFKGNESNQEYVKYTLYNISENLQKKLRLCIQEPCPLETFKSLAEQFERNIIGVLPM